LPPLEVKPPLGELELRLGVDAELLFALLGELTLRLEPLLLLLLPALELCEEEEE
jgi:hypothetical protein